MLKAIAFYFVVLVTNIIQCITGFAGTVLAMPFSLMLVGYDVAKPVLNVLGIAASIGVLFSVYKKINKKEFIKILAVMIFGIAAGIFIKPYVTSSAGLTYKLLGSIVIVLAVYNAILFFLHKDDKEPNPVLSFLLLLLSGIVHGVFVCGGPLLVTYASSKLKDKDEFRATLSAVWIVLNTILMFDDIRAGYFNANLLLTLGISLAVLIAAIFIGNYVSKKMSKNVFMIITYILMIISGISLFLK